MKAILGRFGAHIALAIALTCAVFVSMPLRASAYSCTTSHCYGVIDWSGATRGAAVDISIHGLYSNNGVSHINNVMWVTDDPGNWVEGGYRSNLGVTSYYWGDSRPGSTYFRHVIMDVPGGDYGNGLDINITKTDGSTFLIAFHVNAVGWASYNYSTANTMSATHIQIGQELAGFGGEHADQAAWTYNQWQDSSGTYHFQTANGGAIINAPVSAGWGEYPSNSGIGGVWYASCGC